MMVPLVTAFSASCSTKLTLAPRPAVKAGSSAATVTCVGITFGEWASAAPVMPTRVTVRAAANATAIFLRGGLAARARLASSARWAMEDSLSQLAGADQPHEAGSL